MDSQYVGVDWSSGVWVAIVYSEGETTPTVDVFGEIREVWEEYVESAQRIVVDVPIGLCESVDLSRVHVSKRTGKFLDGVTTSPEP